MEDEAIGELFAALGPIRTRKMFGGRGVYRGDLMFALEAGGELYLKTDAASAPLFEAAGSRPFAYRNKARSVTTRYCAFPRPPSTTPMRRRDGAGSR